MSSPQEGIASCSKTCAPRPDASAEAARHLVRRLADDRPLPERARLVAKQLVGGKSHFELAAANLCEGGRLLATRLHLPDEVARALGQVTTRWDGASTGPATTAEPAPLSSALARVCWPRPTPWMR